MKSNGPNWGKAARFLVCALLLLWIFHSIFLGEARAAYANQNLPWDPLGRAGQWRAAWTIGPQALWATLSMVNPACLILSILVVGLIILTGIIRWRLVLQAQGLDLPFWRSVEISLVAHFFNSFLLGTTGGDLLKAYYAARETHHKKTEAVVTVLVDRLIGFLAMLLFAAIFMLANFSLIARHPPLKTLSGIILFMLAGGLTGAVVIFWPGPFSFWPKAEQFLRLVPKGELIERSLRSSRAFGRQPMVLVTVLLLSMIVNGLTVLQVLALARGLSLSVPALVFFLIVPMIICMASLPITPSGLGVRENLFVVILAAPTLAVPGKVAVSLSLLAYAGSLLWSLIGGVVYACVKEREHLSDIASEQSDRASLAQ